MRSIGRLDKEQEAKRFGDLLYLEGISNQIDPSPGNSWDIWIHKDEQIARARDILAKFMQNPDSTEFQPAPGNAAKARENELKNLREFQKKQFDRTRLFQSSRIGIVTAFMIGFSITATLFANFGENNDVTNIFRITRIVIIPDTPEFTYNRYLPEIAHGQIWRLVTPAFLHLGFIHLFFNMLWTRDLGTLLERRHGPIVFTGMVLLFAVLSNVAQFLIADPSFGGMSGVVYGMLGYIWIRGRTDPFYEIHLSQQTTAMMIGWFLIGFAAESLHIANTAHATGLALGMLTGFVSGTLAKKTRFSRPGSQ